MSLCGGQKPSFQVKIVDWTHAYNFSPYKTPLWDITILCAIIHNLYEEISGVLMKRLHIKKKKKIFDLIKTPPGSPADCQRGFSGQ